MKSILFLALLYVINSEEYPCNMVKLNPIGLNYRALGVCLGNKQIVNGAAVTSSFQYVCNDDENGVEMRSYSNTECTGDPSATPTEVASNSAYFECNKGACPIFEARIYDAEKNGDSCTKEEAFADLAVPVEICVAGYKWVCDSTSLKQNRYWTSSVGPLNIAESNYDTKFNCTYDTVDTTTTLHETGCQGDGLAYTEVQKCSMAPNHSFIALFTLLIVSVFINM